MSRCQYCDAAKGKADVIYEDDKLVAFLAEKPATDGHIIVVPKKHYQIVEQIPDFELAYLFNTVNKLSIAAFEGVKAQGSNIIVQNGVAAGQTIPHVSVHIIPRNEKDNLNFQWQPKQLTEEQMSTVELQLKEGSKNVGQFQLEEKKEPIKLKKKVKKIKAEEKAEDYMIKQLERIP